MLGGGEVWAEAMVGRGTGEGGGDTWDPDLQVVGEAWVVVSHSSREAWVLASSRAGGDQSGWTLMSWDDHGSSGVLAPSWRCTYMPLSDVGERWQGQLHAFGFCTVP